MRPIIVFEQLRLIFTKLEDLQIERDLFRETCLKFVPGELLEHQTREALSDPERRKMAHGNFEKTLKSLEELAQMFVTEELSKAPPPYDQQH